MNNLFKSGNPVLSEKTFRNNAAIDHADSMTVRGTLNKFCILFVLAMASAALAWDLFYSGKMQMSYLWISVFGALIIAVVIAFKARLAPYLAPVYGLLKGFALGAVSATYNNAFEKVAPNIVVQAVALTFGVVLTMFFLYSFRIIKATEKFKGIIMAATGGIVIFYVVVLILRFAFNISVPFLHEGTTFGLIFSFVVVGIAALNLILDFDMIEQGAGYGAPKYMEWYGAFGLMVTIVWLYLELLRLLAKFAGRK